MKIDRIKELGYSHFICCSVDCARILIQNGAWISNKISGGRTALHIAAQYGHVEIVQLICERGEQLKILKKQSDEAGIF